MPATRHQLLNRKGFNLLQGNLEVLLFLFLGFFWTHSSNAHTGELDRTGAEHFECDGIAGLTEYPSVMFLQRSNREAFEQSTLLAPPAEDSVGSRINWLEVLYSEKGIQFHYRLPELGLPINLYNVRIEVLDRFGQILVSEQLFDSRECTMMSLFAGQKSRLFKVPTVPQMQMQNEYRVRVRLLGVDR